MAGDYRRATVVLSPNYGYPARWGEGRMGHKPVAIVDHIEDGTQAGTIQWFGEQASLVSAHYSVSRAGQVFQHVYERDAAWSNGINPALGLARYKSDVSIPWIADLYAGNVNANLVTISIEHEGWPNIALTSAQYDATLDLHRDIFVRNGWPVEYGRIVGHYQVNAVDRPNCPGPLFPFARIYADLCRLLHS